MVGGLLPLVRTARLVICDRYESRGVMLWTSLLFQGLVLAQEGQSLSLLGQVGRRYEGNLALNPCTVCTALLFE